jgi:hypothetical protein
MMMQRPCPYCGKSAGLWCGHCWAVLDVPLVAWAIMALLCFGTLALIFGHGGGAEAP